MISVFFVLIVLFIGACARTYVGQNFHESASDLFPTLGRSVPGHKFRRGAAPAGSMHSESYHPVAVP